MVSLVNRHDGLVGVVFLVCLARVVFVGGVDRPRDVSPSEPSLVTMKTSCISPSCPRWSDCGQNLATASMTTAFAGVVSSSVSRTACAIWSLLYPNGVRS